MDELFLTYDPGFGRIDADGYEEGTSLRIAEVEDVARRSRRRTTHLVDSTSLVVEHQRWISKHLCVHVVLRKVEHTVVV